MSKRKLRQLVEEGYVQGWDDPRLPTIAALRRRGVTPAAIRDFCQRIGVARSDSAVDLALLEHCIREDLNKTARRVMAVLEPLKVVITNWPEDKVEWLPLENLPGDEAAGSREVPFTREIYIEQEDFMENPPKGYHRLAPGREVRLKGAYIIQCQQVIKDASGKAVELRCTYDPLSRSGQDTSGKKVRGVIHWVSARYGVPATVRLYENLFLKENPEEVEEGQDFTANINPHSLTVLTGCIVEPELAGAEPGSRYQFCAGYFCLDRFRQGQPDLQQDSGPAGYLGQTKPVKPLPKYTPPDAGGHRGSFCFQFRVSRPWRRRQPLQPACRNARIWLRRGPFAWLPVGPGGCCGWWRSCAP